MKVILAHPGTQHSRHLAFQLEKNGVLFLFMTGFAISSKSFFIQLLLKLLPKKVQSKLRNRLISIAAKKIVSFPLVEFCTLKKIKNKIVTNEEIFYERNQIFQKKINNEFIKDSDIVIGYDTSSWILAKKSKQFNKGFVLDMTTAEPTVKSNIIFNLYEKFPQWDFNKKSRYDKFLLTDTLEQNLADKIVVASSYAKKTLLQRNVPENKIIVNPYGVDHNLFFTTKFRKNDRIKFLFVGSVSALKGIPILLEAWKLLKNYSNIELNIVGPIEDDIRKLVGHHQGLKIWGGCSQKEVSLFYRNNHVFVFPSLSDGFGQVILEALSSGLPVITTENTCGPDLIQNSKQGFIIPPGDILALFRSMIFFIKNPSAIEQMSMHACETAKSFSWDEYGNRWIKILNELKY